NRRAPRVPGRGTPRWSRCRPVPPGHVGRCATAAYRHGRCGIRGGLVRCLWTVRPGPRPAWLYFVVAWQPANGTEHALADALERGDRPGFFEILAGADLFLPACTDEPEDSQRFVVAERCGVTFLPVFTSLPALALVREVADGYRVTSYPELREKWPRPDWRLAINPGTPLDVYLPIDAIAEGGLEVPSAAEAVE